MKRNVILLAALALLLVLCGCGGAAESSAPEPGAETSSEVSAAPEPTPTPPPEEPMPTPDPLEALLAEQTMDDDHDAFLVPTGGRLGTLLVTVERGTEIVEDDVGGYHPVALTVWDPQDMDAPLQTMETKLRGPYALISRLEDANFDGYMDFEFLCNQYVRAQAFDLWLWDEDAGQFVEEPAFAEVLNPSLDPETRTVGGIVRVTWDVDQLTEYHWEDGRLVCDRMVEYLSPNPDEGREEGEMVVYEVIDGELTEVSREPYEMMG